MLALGWACSGGSSIGTASFHCDEPPFIGVEDEREDSVPFMTGVGRLLIGEHLACQRPLQVVVYPHFDHIAESAVYVLAGQDGGFTLVAKKFQDSMSEAVKTQGDYQRKYDRKSFEKAVKNIKPQILEVSFALDVDLAALLLEVWNRAQEEGHFDWEDQMYYGDKVYYSGRDEAGKVFTWKKGDPEKGSLGHDLVAVSKALDTLAWSGAEARSSQVEDLKNRAKTLLVRMNEPPQTEAESESASAGEAGDTEEAPEPAAAEKGTP